VQFNRLLPSFAKIAAILDMYRNFFAVLMWQRHSCLAMVGVMGTQVF